MPLYEYICDTCHGDFEIRRSFADTTAPTCPTCNGSGRVRRIFSAPAIVFKGSGFYVTDARGKNSAGSPTVKKDTGEGASSTDTASASPSTSAPASPSPSPAG